MLSFKKLDLCRFLNCQPEKRSQKNLIVCLLLFMTVNSFALENSSFESEDPLHGWECVIINEGQGPSIVSDCNNLKDGKQSLLITSNDPADIAIVQKVKLPPDSLWRASYWVQTEYLYASDSTKIGGTLHIRTMDNLSVAETPSNFGTSPWKKEEVLFRVPISGEVQIVLFFVGFGKGTGKAYFDDVRLEKIADAPTHVPVTGPKSLKVELLDEVMLKYREKIGCTAATLAISKKGRILYRRGYGWQDREKTIPTNPDTMIGIASCDKPIILAAIKRLAKQKRVSLDTKLFEALAIKPQGSIIDPRVNNITLNHILEHKAGWGADSYTPAINAAREAGIEGVLSIEVLLSFIMTMPLEDEPGAVGKYSNFGFDILRHIVEKWSGKTFVEYACTALIGMSRIKGMHTVGQPYQNRTPPLIWNDTSGGTVSASAKTLCFFMKQYWFTGELRKEGNPYWIMYGSLDGSTAMMVWRSDGLDLVALFNGRSNVGHDEIRNDLEKIIDQIK